jgi:hypothetical protein
MWWAAGFCEKLEVALGQQKSAQDCLTLLASVLRNRTFISSTSQF